MQQQVGVDGAMLGHAALTGGGSRRIMVHSQRAEEARTLLDEVRADDEQAVPEPVNARYLEEARGRGPRHYGLVGGFARIFLFAIVT
jgi:hypothetical protein